MPPGEALEDNDDYIISLLKRDAEEHKKRSTTLGNVSSFLPSTAKRRPDASKPNTRFLKNIIRETDSHNAALKAKEEEESRARLKELRREEGKRKRDDEGGLGREKEGKRRKGGREREGRWASALGLDGASDRSRTKIQQSRSNRDDKNVEESKHRHRHRRERHEDERSQRRPHRSHHTERSRSREGRRSSHNRKDHRTRSPSRSLTPPSDNVGEGGSHTDPLTAFLGPQPAHTLPRGRGALKASTIDDRFSQSYDPTSDVALNHSEDEGDDWDMALEALKARTKWRTQGAERLRAAGFTAEEVERWEKSGGAGREKDVEDVRWRKRGEGREWDRGKVLDGEGSLELKPEWAK